MTSPVFMAGLLGFMFWSLWNSYALSPELIVALLSAEHGEFLALDLGGTNFRVLWVRVTDNGLQKVEMENQIYAIPEDIMRGSGTQVWRPLGLWALQEQMMLLLCGLGGRRPWLPCLPGDAPQCLEVRWGPPSGEVHVAREHMHETPGSGCALVGGILTFCLIWALLACTGDWGIWCQEAGPVHLDTYG